MQYGRIFNIVIKFKTNVCRTRISKNCRILKTIFAMGNKYLTKNTYSVNFCIKTVLTLPSKQGQGHCKFRRCVFSERRNRNVRKGKKEKGKRRENKGILLHIPWKV